MSDAPINRNISGSKPKAVDPTRSMMQNYLNLLRATKPNEEDSASQLDQSAMSTEFQSQGLVVAQEDSGSNISNSESASIGVGMGTGNLNQANLPREDTSFDWDSSDYE
ncbi:hypothetical protein C8R46DRAFT_1030269 [Mycena filopes]|nr:hypothetical protein C8R46DRAFT_1030269 [Mycena filopes]